MYINYESLTIGSELWIAFISWNNKVKTLIFKIPYIYTSDFFSRYAVILIILN